MITDKSKKMMTISYKPLMELLNTDILFDVIRHGNSHSRVIMEAKIEERESVRERFEK